MSDVYSIIKTVATAPFDAKGYRVGFCACSDFSYMPENNGQPQRWSDEALAETVKRATNNGALLAEAIRCDRETWEKAYRGELNGHAAESSLTAEVIPGKW